MESSWLLPRNTNTQTLKIQELTATFDNLTATFDEFEQYIHQTISACANTEEVRMLKHETEMLNQETTN